MGRGPRRAVRALAAWLAVMFVTAIPSVAAAESAVAFSIKDSRINRSSGLVRDSAANLYWTVNDSDAAGTIYGLTPQGAVQGTLNYRAVPQDAEAVAMYGDRLYVADIGDRQQSRDYVTVYLFPNPRASGLTVQYRSFDFAYPDGQHDAQAFLVDKSGRFYLVTSGPTGAIYAAPPDPSRSVINNLERVADAPAYVSDGVFLPNGDQIALRTRDSVEVVDARTYRPVASTALGSRPRGKSIAVSLDGKSLLLGSEGADSKVYAVKIPTAATPTASASAKPSGSSTGSPGSTDGGDDGTNDTANQSGGRAGTFLALGLAAFVALVAGVVVAAVRKP